ncbi:MAG TPA: iron ABC transporter permease [Bacillota bacterium]|nr:iron ABC transporter permease [Bacillota bacterium]
MAIPIIYVIIQGAQADPGRWRLLFDQRIPVLLNRSLGLTVAVTSLSLLVGVPLAWLVSRTDLPGREVWRWLLALPMVIPPYVGAMTYIIVFGPRGLMWQTLGKTPLDIYSFTGVSLVLASFTFPYVFLLASSALRRMNRNYEEAAAAAGFSPLQVALKVTLPLLRPAVGAGALLVALYVLADFGAVNMLRYSTFTTAIFYQIGSFDQTSAAILSVILVSITVLLLYLENRSKAGIQYSSIRGTWHCRQQISLGRVKPLAAVFVSIVFFFTAVLPLAVLVFWSIAGIASGALDPRFFGFAMNSLMTAGVAALVAGILALPVVYLRRRHPGVVSGLINRLSYTGYSLPGVIVALGMIFLFNNYLPLVYGTASVLILAYIIRFMPQSMQATETALSQVPPQLEEAAQSLGFGPWMVLRRITTPLAMPGIMAGISFVFVSSLKELPATLLLRPAGMDTLAVRIWIEASEAFYYRAAPAALLIVLLSVLPLKWMLSKY